LVVYLSPAIRNREGAHSVLKVVGLAWIYILDTIINSVYTTLFGLGWFFVLAQHVNEGTGVDKKVVAGTGGDTIQDTAGFTDPSHPGVSKVDVVVSPAPGALTGQQAVAYGYSSSALSAAIFEKDSFASLTALAFLWMIRIYFCLVILSFARSYLRHYIATSTAQDVNAAGYSQSDDVTMAENPFRAGREEGNGWQGALGRFMLRFPTARYWLGKDGSGEEWARATSGRFESGRLGGAALKVKVPPKGISAEEQGVGERERRARSGTGPPVPLVPLGKKGVV
jgi:inositol phosphorylceramide synthase regulatory subunit